MKLYKILLILTILVLTQSCGKKEVSFSPTKFGVYASLNIDENVYSSLENLSSVNAINDTSTLYDFNVEIISRDNINSVPSLFYTVTIDNSSEKMSKVYPFLYFPSTYSKYFVEKDAKYLPNFYPEEAILEKYSLLPESEERKGLHFGNSVPLNDNVLEDDILNNYLHTKILITWKDENDNWNFDYFISSKENTSIVFE